MNFAPDGKTDEAIALEVQKNNAPAFGVLVERYEEKISRYGRRFFRSGDDVKDLVQDVFLKAYTNIQSFDATRRFSPWIYRIAHNEFVNAIRKRSGKETVSMFDLDILFPHPVAKETADEKANRTELKKTLDRHLTELRPKYREPLILYYYEDMDYKEIADILQIPISTVGIRLRRGKGMLQKFVKELKTIHG